MVRVEPVWHKVLEAVEDPARTDIIYVLGGVDTGKTTFCGFLREKLGPLAPTAFIDCDPGQSIIGPPATVGGKLADGEIRLRFVGSTSPQGHLLQTVSGIKKLTEWALERGARKLILDSSGFVTGAGATEFQFQAIDLVRPTHIVTFQRGLELESVLANLSASLQIHRLMVSKAIIPRTVAQRQAYRRERFRHYFQNASLQELAMEGLGVHGMVPEELADRTRQLLVALCDSEAFVIMLGIVEAIDPEKGRITLNSPPFDAQQVRSIQFGSLRLDRSGRELP